MTPGFPEDSIMRKRPLHLRFATRRNRSVEISLAGFRAIRHGGARKSDQQTRIIRPSLQLLQCCSDLLAQRFLAPLLPPAFRAANRNRPEVELQRLVPELLLFGAKHELSFALNTTSSLI